MTVQVAATSPRGTLLAGAALYAAGAAAAWSGLTRRAPRATGRPSVRDTWRINARIWSSTARRYMTPEDTGGQALGLASAGTLTMQGVGAAAAGAVAQLSSPGTAMTPLIRR